VKSERYIGRFLEPEDPPIFLLLPLFNEKPFLFFFFLVRLAEEFEHLFREVGFISEAS
jgi:hypothetical protein